tara:strand:+ start:1642 stop:2385 length:744 start_codon:yes stop_codon:yes gene_type:complete
MTTSLSEINVIASNLKTVRNTVRSACERVGRDPSEVTIVGVTKTHGLNAISGALAAGLTNLGENRAQEFVPKALAYESSPKNENPAGKAVQKLTWHFIGHLQRNKARQVIPHLNTLHSLDSELLVHEISKRWASGNRPISGKPIRCFLEVNITGESQKYGVPPKEIEQLLQITQNCDALEPIGLMTVAPQTDNPELVRPVFRELYKLASVHGLDELSMGMTNDYEIAIEEGATAVRIGRAIFGTRTS